MKKYIFLLWSIIFVPPLMSMVTSQNECHKINSLKNLDLFKMAINFNHLIDNKIKKRIELHLFWCTGRPYELLQDEYQADRVVNIGGAKWAPKFYPYMREFLKLVPSCVYIIFVCDRLTFESNASILISLSDEFGNRFQIISWEELTENIYAFLSTHEHVLRKFLNQGFCGNPAIASDVYREIGMPLACIATASAPFNTIMWTYTDVDSFLHGLEHKDAFKYIQAILSTKNTHKGNLRCRDSLLNNVVKFSFKDKQSFYQHVAGIVGDLSVKEELICPPSSQLHSLNYISTLISFVKSNNFEGYLELYASDEDDLIEDKIYGLTGYLWNRIQSGNLDFKRDAIRDVGTGFYVDQLEYPQIFTEEWCTIPRNISGGFLFYDLIVDYRIKSGQPFPDNIIDYKYEMYQIFRTYIRHLRRAMIIKRFGMKHPFYISLLNWLNENNPYMSDSYLKCLKNYADGLDGGLDELRTEMSKAEQYFLDEIADIKDYPGYLKKRLIMKNLGVDFPLVPESDTKG